jgi:hypothetical protein
MGHNSSDPLCVREDRAPAKIHPKTPGGLLSLPKVGGEVLARNLPCSTSTPSGRQRMTKPPPFRDPLPAHDHRHTPPDEITLQIYGSNGAVNFHNNPI